ncbi:MAG: hypothetical protein M1832_004535 [Thelocarpon impressellum]|nr:MAG: hypothetical protein M1832_004535 [Thelocarpon impressellum]
MAQEIDTEAYTTPFRFTPSNHRQPYPALSTDRPELSAKGKVIIISGGGSGIGAAAAKVWARAGASGITLLGRRANKLDEVAKELGSINKDTKVLTVPTDIVVEKDVQNAYGQVQKTFGRPADVLLHNVGFLEEAAPLGREDTGEWLKSLSINVIGFYLMVNGFIRAQPDPAEPIGTIISVSSGIAGITNPGSSAYSVSKLAEIKMGEFVHAEYPKLRSFTTMPGIVDTDMPSEQFRPYALDHVDLTGLLALYLAQPRADYLRGSIISVNWDVEEMEAHRDEIEQKKLLQMSWLPVLPIAGGKGIGA